MDAPKSDSSSLAVSSQIPFGVSFQITLLLDPQNEESSEMHLHIAAFRFPFPYVPADSNMFAIPTYTWGGELAWWLR